MKRRVIRPGPMSEAVAALFVGFVWGGLLVGSAVHDRLYLPEIKDRLRAEKTSEILSANSDYQACLIVSTAQVLLQVPGFEKVIKNAELAAPQLPPEYLEWCRRGGMLTPTPERR